MTTDLATRNGGEMTNAVEFSDTKLDLLKRTICRGASDDEFELFVHACKRTGLDPFMKQIHAVMRHDRKLDRQVMSIQTGIDGYRLIADRTGRYAGNDEPRFEYNESGNPISATAKVYKIVAGQRYPFEATARWDEYYPGDGNPGFMWRKMPHVMLGKVAEGLALRKAFPAELSGVYTGEEMGQAGGAGAMPAAAQEPDALNDDDAFRGAVVDAFTARGFNMDQMDPVIEKVLRKHKVKSLADLGLETRHAFIASVASGELDKLKGANGVPAGASA